MIKLISTDFDGTLHADHEDPPVPDDLQALIGDLQSRGAQWVINTGRDLAGLLEAVARARLRIKPDFTVVVEREIYRHTGAQYVDLADWNHRCRRLHAELFDRVRRDVRRLTAWVNGRYPAMVYEDAFSPFCVIAESNAGMDAIQAFLQDYCGEVPGLAVMRNDVYARFNHAEFNKGTALAEIARRLGVKPEETFAAGDHLNDVQMLSRDVAHCLVAPDNAVPQVKELVLQQGGYVSHQPWGHGVARGLKYWLDQAGRAAG
ncbi:MAG: HAD family phosphatase [Verrucomicrobia bacterium]|nr:HAD family phosphatase [Verrucomicrobiota bacterium]